MEENPEGEGGNGNVYKKSQLVEKTTYQDLIAFGVHLLSDVC